MTLKEKKLLFSKEYSDLFDYLYKYVCFRVSDRSDAEDLVSESLLQAYGRLSDFDASKGKLRQWVTGIVKNKMLMYWRSQKVFVDLDSIGELSDGSTVHAKMMKIDSSLSAEKLFDSLSVNERVMMTLRYVDGLSHDEIAEQIDKTSASVRKYFSRLHKRLQGEFAEYYV